MEGTTNCRNSSGPLLTSMTYDVIKDTAEFILSRTDVKPKIGLICGTGMSSVPSMIKVNKEFDYSEIPNFPRSTVEGHAGKLLLGYVCDVPVICMKGRVHHYEGYDMYQCTMPVRVMRLCGATHLIMSNAAGALNENFKIGDIMIIKDHVNFLSLSGVSPLRGPNDERWGPRFLPSTELYDRGMRQMAKIAAEIVGCQEQVHEGVFSMVGGPNFETVSECRLLRLLGADTVGMSTAHEALIGHHCGMKVLGFSLVTNICDFEFDSDHRISHGEIMASGFKMELMIRSWISKIISLIAKEL